MVRPSVPDGQTGILNITVISIWMKVVAAKIYFHNISPITSVLFKYLTIIGVHFPTFSKLGCQQKIKMQILSSKLNLTQKSTI